MAARVWSTGATLLVVILAHGAPAQDQRLELTPAGKAILQSKIALDSRAGSTRPLTFPVATCTFPGGLCGAVRRDGTVAVPPRYDWVGPFSESRAAVRIGGLYGFVDEDGREVVKPQYRIVEDYKFGFAQVDVDGKSGLIDRDGKMVVEPKYGFIRAIGPDRFGVSEFRELGGMIGGENFSGSRTEFTASGGMIFSTSSREFSTLGMRVIDTSGQLIEPASHAPAFDKSDPSIRWVQRDKLWGLARADGSWLVEPKFEQPGPLSDGLARVVVNGKFGFIDRTGNFAIAPVFDKAGWFERGLGRTFAERDGIVGVIDRTGSWVFRTNYQQVYAAVAYRNSPNSGTVFGWHFKRADRWGLLDLEGRVVLDAHFDQSVQQHCADDRVTAYRNKEWLYFKPDGSPLQPADGRLIDASCGGVPPYTLKIGNKFGLVDAQFNPLTPVHFDATVWAAPGIKNVRIDGKWGRIGPDGRWLIEPRFDYLSAGTDIFVASVDGKRGFMRPDGTWLIEPAFDAAAHSRDRDAAFVTVSGATGLLRLTDRSWIVPPRPGVMCDINHAIMSQADGKRAILSRAGETWIDIGAERIGTSLDFGLMTFLKNGKWGLVDTAGQVMVEPRYDEPVFFSPGLRGIAWAKSDHRWCAIDRRGQSVPGIACADANPMGTSGLRFECKVEP
jgi:hypothetical protein